MSQLRVLAWNIKTGNADAPAALKTMLHDLEPDAAAIFEAYSFHPGDPFAHYSVHQESVPSSRKAKWFHEPVSEHGETAALIAPRVKVRFPRAAAMSRKWVAPVHGLTHEPRIYRRQRLRTDGSPWRLSFEHWATANKGNEAAVDEGINRARSFLAAGVRAPSIVLGDLNTSTRNLARLFPKYDVAGHGPDNAIARHASVEFDVLGKFGSDHDALLYTFTAARRTS